MMERQVRSTTFAEILDDALHPARNAEVILHRVVAERLHQAQPRRRAGCEASGQEIVVHADSESDVVRRVHNFRLRTAIPDASHNFTNSRFCRTSSQAWASN